MTTRFAAEQLAKKLRLEAIVKPELNRFFRQISRLIKPVWVVSGQIPRLEPFKADLTALLRKHYTRTRRTFAGDVIKSLQRSLNEKQDMIPSVALETEAELIDIINDRAPEQAQRILETTQHELNAIIASVAVAAAIAGDILTPQQEAKRITQDFNSRIPGRTSTIAMTETQAMAEEAKETEANAIAATGVLIGSILISQAMIKEWGTILDENTRESHVIADGQKRKQGQPYRVQGQLLMFPGDTGLGASLDNVIGCRCSSEFGIEV